MSTVLHFARFQFILPQNKKFINFPYCDSEFLPQDAKHRTNFSRPKHLHIPHYLQMNSHLRGSFPVIDIVVLDLNFSQIVAMSSMSFDLQVSASPMSIVASVRSYLIFFREQPLEEEYGSV